MTRLVRSVHGKMRVPAAALESGTSCQVLATGDAWLAYMTMSPEPGAADTRGCPKRETKASPAPSLILGKFVELLSPASQAPPSPSSANPPPPVTHGAPEKTGCT